MTERDETHAHEYRLLQANQLLAARATGLLGRLMGDLDTLREAYPDIFAAEARALQAAIEHAVTGIMQLENEKED